MKYIRIIISIGMFLLSGMGLIAAANGGNENSPSFPAQLATQADGDDSIYGLIIYQNHQPLPAHALLTVHLLDITKQDSTYDVVAQSQQKIDGNGQLAFTLPLSAQILSDNHIYALAARISVGDVLWFVNEKLQPIAPGTNNYLVRLEKVERTINEATTKPSLTNREWRVQLIDTQATLLPYPSLKIEDLTTNTNIPPSSTQISATNVRYKVTGTGSCNHYFSTATVDETKKQLHFSPLGMTFMACEEAIQNQENHFADMMSRVHAYQLDADGHLLFLDQKGEMIAQFGTNF